MPPLRHRSLFGVTHFRRLAVLFGPLVLTLLLAAPVSGLQDTASVATVITGQVIDAADGSPLAGAHVHLDPFGRRAESPDGASRTAWDALTPGSGWYRFTGVPPGKYRVRVYRPGYTSRSVDVTVVGDETRSLTVGLELRPILLPSLTARSIEPEPYTRTASAGADRLGARRAVVRVRQREHLPSDVRSLTAAEVADAVTLGEPDLFRAIQRMPGVGRRDDYTAVLWSRGADWPLTRVYFDGLPLFNPTHAGSLFSSISPNGVGEVTYHPGLRSARWGEGAAGLLDLRSRLGGLDGPLSGRGGLSLVSGQMALDGRMGDVARWTVTARRTHVDLLSRAWAYLTPQTRLRVPYDFSDVTGRMSLDAGPLVVEASTLNERDRLRGDIPGLLVNNSGRWGNRLGRVTLGLRLRPVELSVTRGATRFATIVDEEWREEGAVPSDTGDASLPALENGIDHDLLRFRAVSGAGWPDWLRWGLGIDVIENRVRYDGPFSLLGEGIPGLARDSLDRIPFSLTAETEHRAVWGEVGLDVPGGIEILTGVRVESGDSVRNGGRERVAPRLSARWTLSPKLSVSAGWNRIYQYIQAIGATGGPLGPQLHLSNLWILAGLGYPAVKAEITTVGAELWLDERWLLSATVYDRHMAGLTEPDPTPGTLRPDRSHVEAENLAQGLELAARRLAGRWTASFGYALARSDIVADSLRYPSSSDIRHALDASLSYRVDEHVWLGAASSYASGVPYTRIVVTGTPHVEEPNGHRTPAYLGLDLVLEYTTQVGRWTVGGYLQLVNALGRENEVTYAGTVERCLGGESLEQCAGAVTLHDRFRDGLPRLPLVGVHVAF